MEKDTRKDKAPSSSESRTPLLSQSMRILRLAESLGLRPETIRSLRESLLPDAKKEAPAAKAAEEAVPSRYPTIERISAEEAKEILAKAPPAERAHMEPAKPAAAANRGAASPATSAPRTASPPSPAQSPAKSASAATSPASIPLDKALDAELRLRKKIESEQNWAAFRLEAWQLFESFPRPDMGARITELAFLYGSVNELEDVIGSLSKHSVEFLLHIDSQLRSHMVVKLWQAKRFQLLDSILFRKEMALRLLPSERLYCCWSYIERGQEEQAYRFYRRFDNEIIEAQKIYGAQLQKSESELRLVMGRTAMQHEDESLAASLLESIPNNAPEFQKALDLLLDLRVERDDQGFCGFGQKLSRELDWKARIGLLDSFLLRMQRVEYSAPKERAALNALLVDPMKWFPETPDSWHLLSELLMQYSGLESLLPNLMRMFTERATQFFKPAFEHALWSPVLDHNFRDPVKTWFWRSIALMHEFVWGLGQDEKKLWESRRVYQEAASHHGKSLPISWQVLHRALLQWVQKSERLNEAQRVKLLLAVKLVGDARDLSEQDISTYLIHVPMPSPEILGLLETLARERQQWGLELFILDRKARIYHHTNQSLNRLWQLGAQLKQSDLCWRAATLLKVRQVLNPDVERHWAISGEKRREFPFVDITEAQMKKVAQSFEGYERKFIEALLLVGPLIPELLAGLHQHLTPVKKSKTQSPAEEKAQVALDKLTWVPSAKKLFSANPSGLWQPKPPFFSNLIDSRWSMILVGLAQRLGITTWDWQLSLLNQQIENLVPKMARGDEETSSGKVGRWLRNLTPSQRKAWYEIAQMPKRFDDEKATEILSRFLVRLTTCMYQDHQMALQNLEKMRAPLSLRWDLENWIVSDAYAEIRKSMGTQATGTFSEDVYRMKPLHESLV